MARDYRTLKLEILAETKQFVDDMKKGETQVESFGDKATKMGKVAAAAFAAATAAAVAYAGKLAIEGVKAAIEDEAAQNRLANALKNVTGATEAQIKSVEKQINKLSLANGIADDQLRPAFQRLATATGDLTKANTALELALDISAATGKDLNAVSNALGKAYEGNTASLGRLGIGLSTAEMKTLGLDGTMKKLAETFGGAATVQANTLEGQIQRLKVGFDEAKESVGAALLPIVQKFMDYIVNTLIPMLQKAKAAAIDPIVVAFNNNREALEDLWFFTKTYLVPIFQGALIAAITNVGKAIAGILNIIGAVVSGIKNLVNDAISAINKIIEAYNKIPILPNVPTIPKVSGSTNPAPSGQTITLPDGAKVTIPSTTSSDSSTKTTPSTPAVTTTISTPKASSAAAATTAATAAVAAATTAASAAAAAAVEKAADPATWMPAVTASVAQWRAAESGDVINMPGIPSNFDVARFRAAEEGVTIIVQAPSAIDEEGFKRAVVDALNESANRGTGGGGGLRDTAQIL